MMSSSHENHEPMSSSPPGLVHSHGHGHGNQSQFLPNYLLGDSLSLHTTASPRLWSSGVSPGLKANSTPLSSGRLVGRVDSVKGRTTGPPVRSLLSCPAPDSSLASPLQPVKTAVAASARITSPGPPTAGLIGTPGLRGDITLNQCTTLPSSPTQLDPFYTQGESLKPDDVLDETWITIFGFPSGATSFILQQFAQYGNIVKHVPSAEGNWIHVHYQSKLQAKKALSKNGKVYGGRMMIGVLPCIDKAMRDSKENDLNATPTHHISQDLSSSIQSAGTPIRPLTAAYTASRSEYEVLKNKQTPKKDNSIVSKVKEYMFGW